MSPGGSPGLPPAGGGSPAFRTRTAQADRIRNEEAWPLARPIVQGDANAVRDPDDAVSRLAVGPPEPANARVGISNLTALERAVADLEGAEDAHAASSGMAAIGLVFLAHLSAGDHAVASADCYFDTEALLAQELARFGVTVTFAALHDPDSLRAALAPRTRIVYGETISNPALKLFDFSRAAAAAHDAGALLVVDNTFATPALCRPLAHGADLVVHSATKFLGGHHDLTAGVVAGRRDLIARVRRAGRAFGSTLGALDAWLALRGIETLAPRMAWISGTAAEVAAFLAAQQAVARVRYPGLPDAPQAVLARRLLPDGAGGMLAFDLDGGPAAVDAFTGSLRSIPYVPSLGGVETTVYSPPRRDPGGASPSPAAPLPRSGTVRVSVGLEDPRDLIADLAQALDRVPPTAPSPGGRTPPDPAGLAA